MQNISWIQFFTGYGIVAAVYYCVVLFYIRQRNNPKTAGLNNTTGLKMGMIQPVTVPDMFKQVELSRQSELVIEQEEKRTELVKPVVLAEKFEFSLNEDLINTIVTGGNGVGETSADPPTDDKHPSRDNYYETLPDEFVELPKKRRQKKKPKSDTADR